MKTKFFTKAFLYMSFMSVLLFSVNCDSFTGGDGLQPQSRQTLALIVAGATMPGTYEEACYWINGEQISLHNPAWMYSFAYDIAVSGNNIYVCGQYNNGTTDVACYWINNADTRVELPVPGTATYPTASRIIVNGSDVYVLGNYDLGATYCYWINSVRTDITLLTITNDMFFYNGNLYLAGQNSAYYVAYYMVGDAFAQQITAASNHQTESIFVDVNGIHILSYYPGTGYSYWLNGTDVTITLFNVGLLTGYTMSKLYISGNDVFASGYSTGTPYQACYWHNTTPTATLTNLGNGTTDSQAVSIQYFEGHVYTCGSQNDGTQNSPCYWIDNGQAQYLAPGIFGMAQAIWDPYMDMDFDLEKCMKNINKK